MKPNIKDKDTMMVQETVAHYKLSWRKFYELLHQDGLEFIVFCYNVGRLILRTEFEKYLNKHSEIRRREH